MAESLKNKTLKGTFWSAADAFLGQGVMFVVGLVLARLLSPEEYGLIGIVLIFTTVMIGVADSGFSNSLIRKSEVNDDDYSISELLNPLSATPIITVVKMIGVADSGFSNSLIRKSEVNDDDYSTLFYFNLAVSIAMYALLFFGAPWIAKFFERPQLVALVRVMGLLLIIQALSIVQMTILSRKIDFKTKTKASLISSVSSGAIGISMAFMGFEVWSLVGQQLTRQAIYSGCLWYFNTWWPKLRFSVDSLRYMWGFGWKLLLSGLIDKIWGDLKKVVVSKYYSPAMLGQFTKSFEYAKIFSSNFTSIIQRVTYPALAQIKDDKTRMLSAYRRVIKTTMFVTVICMFFVGAISEPLIYCLIGPKWHIAATFLPFICFYRSLYPLQAINLNMLKVLGRTDIFLYLEIAKKTFLLGPLFIGAFIGIYWMLVASIGTSIVAFFLNSYYSGKSLGYSSWMQLKDVAPSYCISFTVALSVFFLKYLPISYWIVFPLQVVFGGGVFLAICESTKLTEYLEIKAIFKDRMKRFLNN